MFKTTDETTAKTCLLSFKAYTAYKRGLNQLGLMRITLLALALAFTALVLAQGAYAAQDWSVWTNPRAQKLPSISLEVFPTYWWAFPRPVTDEDGGYTFHILLKRGSRALWAYTYTTSVWIPFDDRVVSFVQRTVVAWNKSIQYAAEHFEWARHLSKLRLKFYVEGVNETLMPVPPDVVINPESLPECGAACANWASETRKYIHITGSLLALSHELGHALGLGHGSSHDFAREARGWRINLEPYDYPNTALW
ncbi:MAG: hypothetical protein NZ921_03425 [Candidatus Caldarchaeum sp.]|nr:hypothetical protein [Candidatus Caldarchaeum sp.]